MTRRDRFRHRLRLGCAGLLVLIVVAMLGYSALMGWPLLDSLFFVIITLTTIGYDDYELTAAAKWFTMFIIIVGNLGLYTLVLTTGIEYTAERLDTWRKQRMEDALTRLRDHFIVVGYGTIGKAVAIWFQRVDRPILVIEMDEERCQQAVEDGYQALEGDGTDEGVLRRAGIDRAAGLLAVTRQDPINVFVTLTARAMRPDLYIAAVAISHGCSDKVKRAGASVVISPYEIGAQRLVQAAVSPLVAEMFSIHSDESQAGLMLREAELEKGSPLAGKSLRDSNLRDKTQVMIAAVKNGETGELEINPPASRVLNVGDILIGFGTCDDTQRFMKLVAPQAAKELAASGVGG